MRHMMSTKQKDFEELRQLVDLVEHSLNNAHVQSVMHTG